MGIYFNGLFKYMPIMKTGLFELTRVAELYPQRSLMLQLSLSIVRKSEEPQNQTLFGNLQSKK